MTGLLLVLNDKTRRPHFHHLGSPAVEPNTPGDKVCQAPGSQQVVVEHQTPLAWAREQTQAWQVPHTSRGEIAAAGIPWFG